MLWKCNPLSQHHQCKSTLQFGTVAEVSLFYSISQAMQVVSDEVTSAGNRQRSNSRERLFIIDNSFVETTTDLSINEWRRFYSPAKCFLTAKSLTENMSCLSPHGRESFDQKQWKIHDGCQLTRRLFTSRFLLWSASSF